MRGEFSLKGNKQWDKTVQTSREATEGPRAPSEDEGGGSGARGAERSRGLGQAVPGLAVQVMALLQCVLELAAGLLQDGAAARGPGLPVARQVWPEKGGGREGGASDGSMALGKLVLSQEESSGQP